MATAEYTMEDKLICPICLGRFERPRSLPCLHTFCTSCLRAHIETVGPTTFFSTFPCPVCRTDTKPSRPFLSRDKWTEQFPLNYWIVSAMEDEDCRSRDNSACCEEHKGMKINLFCTEHHLLCCAMCVATQHRKCDDVVEIEKMADSINVIEEKENVIKLLDEIQSHIEIGKSGNSESEYKLKQTRHDIERYIREHGDAVISHVKMLQTKLLDEVETECNILEETIKHKKSYIECGVELFNETNESLASLDEESTKVVTFVKLLKMKEKITKHLSSRDSSNQDDPYGVMCDSNDIPHMRCEITEEFRRIQDMDTMGKFIMTEKFEAPEPIMVKENASGIDIDNLRSNSNQAIGIETTETSNENASSVRGNDISHLPEDDSYFRCVGRLNTSTLSNSNGLSWITSAVTMNSNTHIICDHTSSSVKLIKDGGVTFEEKSPNPWGLAKITDSHVAVSYPQSRLVRFFDVKCDRPTLRIRSSLKLQILGTQIKLAKTISTSDPCFGMCCTEHLIVAACEDRIQTYTLSGKPVQSIKSSHQDDGNFRRVINVAYSSHTSCLFSCDEANNCVVTFNTVRTHIKTPAKFVYKHDRLRSPQGIAVGPLGDIYVTGFVSRNIHVISSCGQCLHVVDVVPQPWALSIDAERMLLFISFYPDNGNGGTSYVYSIKR